MQTLAAVTRALFTILALMASVLVPTVIGAALGGWIRHPKCDPADSQVLTCVGTSVAHALVGAAVGLIVGIVLAVAVADWLENRRS